MHDQLFPLVILWISDWTVFVLISIRSDWNAKLKFICVYFYIYVLSILYFTFSTFVISFWKMEKCWKRFSIFVLFDLFSAICSFLFAKLVVMNFSFEIWMIIMPGYVCGGSKDLRTLPQCLVMSRKKFRVWLSKTKGVHFLIKKKLILTADVIHFPRKLNLTFHCAFFLNLFN